MILFASFVGLLADILSLAIFVRSMLSWFPGAQHSAFGLILARVTDPILVPLRRVIPLIGMIDLTPLAAIILLQVLAALVRAAVL